ncbi:MAG: iron ABC transporter permease [Planctomycetes bacterium]|nr:iron ABC transporter permease [Planctomycetota bacterium]
MTRSRLGSRGLGIVLALGLVAIVVAFLVYGSASARTDPVRGLHAFAAWFGLRDQDDATGEALLAMRAWRAGTAAGVGAALAFAGALLQGLFRNALASPSVLGITTGASVGAATAVALAAGLGVLGSASGVANTTGVWLVPLFAFGAALAVGAFVHSVAATRGHLSVPALLLVGLAMNTFLGGVLSLLQQLLLDRWDAMRSLLAWNLGTLVDRGPWHVAVVWLLAAPCFAIAPRIGWELDLLQAGEEDARQLGVDTRRVRRVAFVCAMLCTAAAVAVAGQIAFVGLVVPHLLRLAGVTTHRPLLVLSALAGAAFLCGADLLQVVCFADQLAPGVVMSLVGGPFFVWLLWRKQREIALW